MAPVVTTAQARVAAVACLALLVPMPVPWPITPDTPFGTARWVHIGAFVLLVGYGVGVGRFHGLVGRCAPVLTAFGATTALVVVSAASYGASWADPVQKGLYALVGVAFGAAAHTALSDDGGRRILVWAAPASVAWVVGGLGVRLTAGDLDRLLSGLVAADPRSVERFFRIGFAVEDADGLPNGRHEIVAALLVTILVTVLAAPACRRWVRVVAGVACTVGALVVVASLSRSVLLAVAVPLVAVVVRMVRRSQRRWVVLLGTAGVLAASSWPLGRLLLVRTVDDTGSYTARLDAFDVGLPELGRRVLSGGPPPAASTHTLPGDALLLGGWFAGLCALLVVAVFTGHAVVAARHHQALGGRVPLVALSAATLVLVRSVTTGGGFPDLAAWVAFGLVVALGPRASGAR